MTGISITGNVKQGSQGFTLVEVLVVLTLISLIAGSISYVVLKDKDNLQSLSKEVVQSMRLTQLHAIREDKPYQIEIDLQQNSIEFFDKIITLPDSFFITVKTSSDQLIDNDRAGITFYPDASSTGGSLILESETEMYEIHVTWISGKITSHYKRKT